MTRRTYFGLTLAVLSILNCNMAVGQYAAAVVSYDAGATASTGFNLPASALGSPERFTGEGVFPSVVSPFSPPFLTSELVSIGEGGQLTLRLSNYAIPQAGAPEIGIFSNFGLADASYPNGQAGSQAGGFGPPDSAGVEVSENGSSWVSLGLSAFDIPTNGYTDLTDPYVTTAGVATSDFQQPFVAPLADFNSRKYFDASLPDILDLLAGSGGGKWLDISATGLAKVGYVRFSVADDFTSAKFNFELDGVSISHTALGGATVPEPSTVVFVIAAGLSCLFRFRRHTTTKCLS